MFQHVPSRLWLAAIFAIVAWPASASAGFLAINNAGFETATPLSWTTVGTAGVFNPGIAMYPGGLTPEGSNAGFVNNTASLTQALSATLQANTLYQLNVFVGWRLDNATFNGYAVELFAGATLLASNTNSFTPTQGTFQLATVTYTSAGSGPLLGQTLSIRLRGTGGGIQTNFDDVKLSAESTSAVPAPPAAVLALLGVGCLAAFRRRLPASV